MTGTCRLCAHDAELLESHFVPRFVGRWVKRTSITSFLREVNEPLKRAQDTTKEYLLCSNCESLFSAWERQFASRVFYPFVEEGETVARYGEWMSKFCVSVSWRALVGIRSRNPRRVNATKYYKALDDAEQHWIKYMMGEVDNLRQYEQHLFHLDGVEATTYNELPPNINRYFLRIIAMDIIGNESELFVYTKLPSFIILGCIKVSDPRRMRTSRIATGSGIIGPTQYWFPDGFMDYIVEKCGDISKALRRVSSEDSERLNKSMLNNLERARDSKLLEAFLYDYERFGEDVFR